MHPSIPPEWLSWQHVELILPSSLWSGCTLKKKAFWNVNVETQVIEGKIRSCILPTKWLDAMDDTEMYKQQSSSTPTNSVRFYRKPVQIQIQAYSNSTTMKKVHDYHFSSPGISHFWNNYFYPFLTLFPNCSALEVHDPCIGCPFL